MALPQKMPGGAWIALALPRMAGSFPDFFFADGDKTLVERVGLAAGDVLPRQFEHFLRRQHRRVEQAPELYTGHGAAEYAAVEHQAEQVGVRPEFRRHVERNKLRLHHPVQV